MRTVVKFIPRMVILNNIILNNVVICLKKDNLSIHKCEILNISEGYDFLYLLTYWVLGASAQWQDNCQREPRVMAQWQDSGLDSNPPNPNPPLFVERQSHLTEKKEKNKGK